MTWVCVSRQGAPNISVGLDAGGQETCCVYSLCGWDHMDPRMLNLVLSSVAALFISRPRQARAWLLSVSEKTELMPRVSGGSDESCCAHWLLVFWAPTVEKDNEGRRWRITLRIIPQGNLQQWGPYPMDSAATIPCNFSMRSLAHKAKAIPRPFMVLRVSPEMPWGLLPWGPWQTTQNTPSIPFRTKAAPGNLEIDSGEGQGRGEGKLARVPWKMLPGFFTFYLNH